MPTFANIAQSAAVDGIVYANGVALTGSEVDLGSPISVQYEGIVVASVQIVIPASVSSNTGTYVVMQQDMNDSNWVDLAWCQVPSGTTTAGTYSFMLTGGSWTSGGAFQSRASGTVPTGTTGGNAMGLGARIRFVGKNNTDKAPTATVKVKQQGLR